MIGFSGIILVPSMLNDCDTFFTEIEKYTMYEFTEKCAYVESFQEGFDLLGFELLEALLIGNLVTILIGIVLFTYGLSVTYEKPEQLVIRAEREPKTLQKAMFDTAKRNSKLEKS